MNGRLPIWISYSFANYKNDPFFQWTVIDSSFSTTPVDSLLSNIVPSNGPVLLDSFVVHIVLANPKLRLRVVDIR